MTWDELVSILSSPVMVSAVTSLIVASAILGLDKLVLAPKADKRKYELNELEKRLDAYGELVALLKTTKMKREAQRSRLGRKGLPDDLSHYLEQHDIKTFDKLFGEKARLMSPKLIDLWIGQMGQDPSQVMDRKRRQEPISEEDLGSTGLFLDLRKMEQAAESEYKQLTAHWEKLAAIKLDK
jgi:hypothetical protein